MTAYRGRAFAEIRAVSLADRRLAGAALVGGGFLVVYAAATVAGAPRPLLSQVFNLPMAAVFVVAWWTALTAPREIRALWRLLAIAATCWGVGSAGWAVEFEQNGERVPTPPTVWDIPFAIALALTTTAVVLAIRRSIVVRHVALDVLVIACAAGAVGTAIAERSVDGTLSLRTAAALDRPFFGLLTLVLVISAALGSSDGVRRSTVLLGIGQVFLVTGHLISSYQALSGAPIDDRWCDLAWATGAVVSALAGLCVVRGADPLIRFGPALSPSPHPRGSHVALAAGCLAVAVSLLTVLYGVAGDHGAAIIAGVLAGLVGIGGVALRGRAAIRAADAAYVALDGALAENERQRDQLADANSELASANVQLRLYQETLRGLLAEVDGRSGGRLRELIEETTGPLEDD